MHLTKIIYNIKFVVLINGVKLVVVHKLVIEEIIYKQTDLI